MPFETGELDEGEYNSRLIENYFDKIHTGRKEEITHKERTAFCDSMRSDEIADSAIEYLRELQGKMGSADYKMENGEYTYRYDTLGKIKKIQDGSDIYIISEWDTIKDSGRETKLTSSGKIIYDTIINRETYNWATSRGQL